MDHFPAQLSGGEQQRVAIARAIAKRPEVLLCDEPTGALDSKTGIRVIEALLDINRQLGTTALIITHNASIQEVADRVLFFADGRISRAHKNDARKAAGDLVW
jgi:putative ABC transport system ATP-binding protein